MLSRMVKGCLLPRMTPSLIRKSSNRLRYALIVDGSALFPTYTVVLTVRSLKQTFTVGSFTPALHQATVPQACAYTYDLYKSD